MASLKFNKNFNVSRVVKRLIRTVLALYVGGTVMSTFGSIMINTSSNFYQGLSLIGWSISSGSTAVDCGSVTVTDCITATTGSGVLSVIGIIAIVQIIVEFIKW